MVREFEKEVLSWSLVALKRAVFSVFVFLPQMTATKICMTNGTYTNSSCDCQCFTVESYFPPEFDINQTSGKVCKKHSSQVIVPQDR